MVELVPSPWTYPGMDLLGGAGGGGGAHLARGGAGGVLFFMIK